MMTASNSGDDCKGCKKTKLVSEGKKPVGLLSTILLVLLPKCPFCVMAYSGTLMLCGNAGVISADINHVSSITIIITSFFCLAVLVSIILNYRDVRTKYALLAAVVGCCLIMYSVNRGGGMPLYYSGVFVVFMGVWLNGSLLYVISRLRRKLELFNTSFLK